MKVTVVGPSGALSAGHNPSGERSECEQKCWDPKDGELCLDRMKPPRSPAPFQLSVCVVSYPVRPLKAVGSGQRSRIVCVRDGRT